MFTPIHPDQIPKAERYFIYGASNTGLLLNGFLGAIGRRVAGYFDSSKTGEFNHLPVRPPSEISVHVGPNDLVVIGSVYYLEIEKTLKALGVHNYFNGIMLLATATHREFISMKPFLDRYLPDDGIVIDVGANVGDTAILMSRRARHVYAFEPNPRLFEHFASVTEHYPNVTLVPKGVGDTRQVLKLGISEDMMATASSFAMDATDYVEAECVPLDEWCAENRVVPDFIKIDAEGFDAAVIAGTRGIIERHRPAMIMETNGSDRDVALFKEMSSLYRVVCVPVISDPRWTPDYVDAVAFYERYPTDNGFLMNVGFIPRRD